MRREEIRGDRTKLVAMSLILVVASACSGNVFSLEVGNCYDSPEGIDLTSEESADVSDVGIVECSEEHYFEVYHLFDIDGDEYPGEDATGVTAEEGCYDAFAGYVGNSYEESTLDISFLFPTSDSWKGGDREATCSLFDFEGNSLTGSAKNSGW